MGQRPVKKQMWILFSHNGKIKKTLEKRPAPAFTKENAIQFDAIFQPLFQIYFKILITK